MTFDQLLFLTSRGFKLDVIMTFKKRLVLSGLESNQKTGKNISFLLIKFNLDKKRKHSKRFMLVKKRTRSIYGVAVRSVSLGSAWLALTVRLATLQIGHVSYSNGM